jgi:hypothetical protein
MARHLPHLPFPRSCMDSSLKGSHSKADPARSPVKSRVDRWKDSTAIIQSIATTLALIIGGFWTYTLFISKRENFPHAVISQNVIGKLVTSDWYWLQIFIEVRNTGDTVVSIDTADIRVQQILPLPDDILEGIRNKKDPVPRLKMLIPWKGICRYVRPFSTKIEPGESDRAEAQFLIPAWLHTVRVYSYLGNRTSQEKYGWVASLSYDLKGADANETENMAKLVPNTDRLCAFDE